MVRCWRAYGQARLRALSQAGIVLAVVLASAWYVNLLDFATLANGVPAILTLARELVSARFQQCARAGGSRWSTPWR